MPARFVTTSLVTKRAGIAARFVTLVPFVTFMPSFVLPETDKHVPRFSEQREGKHLDMTGVDDQVSPFDENGGGGGGRTNAWS